MAMIVITKTIHTFLTVVETEPQLYSTSNKDIYFTSEQSVNYFYCL